MGLRTKEERKKENRVKRVATKEARKKERKKENRVKRVVTDFGYDI
jgi:hypothetical protein